MKYKHIIFDIDGTMLDSAYADLMALQKVIWEFLRACLKMVEIKF